MKYHRIPILSTALLAGLLSTVAAQQPASGDPFADSPPPLKAVAAADPFVKDSATPAKPAEEDTANWVKEGVVRVEYFSLPTASARKVLRQFKKQDDLYAWLGAELEKDKAEVKLERLSILRVRGGQRSKLEEIAEFPYPTEFDSPQAEAAHPNIVPKPENPPPPTPAPAPGTPAAPPAPPQKPAGAGTPGDSGSAGIPGAPGTSASAPVPSPGASVPAVSTPTSYVFRNTGWTIEMELTFGEDGKTLDINLAPERIRLRGMFPQNTAGDCAQPGFETGKLTTQILTTVGKPTLTGTISPPKNTGAPNGNQQERTWFLFLTVNNRQ